MSRDGEKQTTQSHEFELGFTILELLVATMVFAVILLVVAAGVISFTNSYYKGVTSAKTQAVARSIIAEISQTVEFGKPPVALPPVSGGINGICIDNTLYAYKIGQEVTDNSPSQPLNQGHHGLIASDGSGCSSGKIPSGFINALGYPGTPVPPGSRELLGQHMRLGSLSVTGSGSLYTIHVRVIYGDNDLLNSAAWATAQCASVTGSQFCAVADLTTTVERRLL